MRQVIIIFVLSYILIYSGFGLELQTTANVLGNGTLYTRTNDDGLEDTANGFGGSQTFTRDLQSGDELSKLTSSYTYIENNSSSNKPHTHYVRGQSSVGILHYANIVSNKSTESKVELEKTDSSIKTNYFMKSGSGHLTEGVIDSRYGAPKIMEETELSGNFTFSSKLSEKLNTQLDFKGLVYKTDSVVLMNSYEVKNGQKIPKAVGGRELSPEDSSIIYYNEAFGLDQTAKSQEGSIKTDTLKKALDNIINALELNPNYSDAWLLKGNILVSLERFDEAFNAYDEADKIKSNVDTLTGKATSLFKLKRYSEAVSVSDKLLELDPVDLFALNLKGKSYLMMGKLSNASSVFKAALDLYPVDSNLLRNMGLVQFALSNSTESKNLSKELIKKALDLGQNNEDPSFAKDAESILREISPEYTAIIYYNEAFELDQTAKGLEGMNKSKALGNALDSISMASSLDPKYFDAWLLKGEILVSLERYREALTAYDEADKIESNVDTLTGKTKSQFYLKRYSEAVSVSDRLLKLNPSDLFALNIKGKSYYMMGNLSDAYQLYNQSLLMYPKNSVLLYNMGLVQLALGKIPESKDNLTLALDSGLEEVNPDFAKDAETKIHDLG